jgi:hypothetical protein
VFVPENITNTYISPEELKPNLMQVAFGYNDEKGANKEVTDRKTLSNDPTKIDSLFLGEFTFPIAYEGTGDYYPYLRLSSRVSSRQTNDYTRSFRIDCVLLIPKDLDEYRKAHPEYKFFDDSSNRYYY